MKSKIKIQKKSETLIVLPPKIIKLFESETFHLNLKLVFRLPLSTRIKASVQFVLILRR